MVQGKRMARGRGALQSPADGANLRLGVGGGGPRGEERRGRSSAGLMFSRGGASPCRRPPPLAVPCHGICCGRGLGGGDGRWGTAGVAKPREFELPGRLEVHGHLPLRLLGNPRFRRRLAMGRG